MRILNPVLTLLVTVFFAKADNVALSQLEVELQDAVKEVNANFEQMEVSIFDWPDELLPQLGSLKKTAFVATHRKTKGGKRPLLVTLHGGGGKNWGIKEQLLRSAKVKGLALAEEAKRDLILFEPNSSDNWEAMSLNRALDHFIKMFPEVDTDRIYLIGHSMGGTGALRWALESPTRFAAISPSGFTLRSELESIDPLLGLPMWFMVGAEDEDRPEGIERLVTRLKEAGHRRVGFTAFPGANHPEANAAVFSSVDLVDWMLEQRRGE